MDFIPTIELVKKAESAGYAVPSFCVWNAETIRTVLTAARELKAPVILMNGWAEFELLSPYDIAAVARSLIKNHPFPVALHLDHGNSIDQIKQGLEAGYSSVMLDYSLKPFNENVSALKEVVELAHPHGVTVEGEIGAIGRVGSMTLEGSGQSELTNPEDARMYVTETGIDMVAVSIGNAHGIYQKLPHLDFELLKEIRRVVNVPLVLHGGSGTPQKDLKHAISLGMAKVNVASELVHTIRESLIDQWNAGKNLYTPIAQARAMKETAKVVRKLIKKTGAEEMA